jgi:hypothetical protein
MVDTVVNNVMATSITPDLSTYAFNDKVRNPYTSIRFVWTFICRSLSTTIIVPYNGVTPRANSIVGSAMR